MSAPLTGVPLSEHSGSGDELLRKFDKMGSNMQEGPRRNLAVEITGTAVSMVIGAFIGSMVPGNGAGWVSFVILCSFLGWVFWIRRRRSVWVTILISALLVIAWWPLGLVVREMGRGL